MKGLISFLGKRRKKKKEKRKKRKRIKKKRNKEKKEVVVLVKEKGLGKLSIFNGFFPWYSGSTTIDFSTDHRIEHCPIGIGNSAVFRIVGDPKVNPISQGILVIDEKMVCAYGKINKEGKNRKRKKVPKKAFYILQ